MARESSGPAIVLMGPHPALCERAKRAGLVVVVVDTPDRLPPAVLPLADHFIATDYTDAARTAALIAALRERVPVCGVLSLTERGSLPAAQVNEVLGIEDNPADVIQRVVDKARMRDWLADDPRFTVPSRVVRAPADLRAFGRQQRAPLIVKPVDGSGSKGVRMVHAHRAPADNAVDVLEFPLLAERYLEGPEFSVEAVSLRGQHRVIGITEKMLLGGGDNEFVEVGHAFPAALTKADEESIRNFVTDILNALGLRQGLSHTEVKLTAHGPALIETHSRNGGDHITDLVLQATGFDLLSFAVRARAGLVGELPETPRARRGAAVRYFTPRPGRVGRLHGQLTARYLPGVVDLQLDLQPGDVVRSIASSGDRVGYVIAAGTDAADAVDKCTAAIDAVTIQVAARGYQAAAQPDCSTSGDSAASLAPGAGDRPVGGHQLPAVMGVALTAAHHCSPAADPPAARSGQS